MEPTTLEEFIKRESVERLHELLMRLNQKDNGGKFLTDKIVLELQTRPLIRKYVRGFLH